MRLRHLIMTAGLVAACAIPAGASAAEKTDPFAEFDAQLERLASPQAWLKGKVSEADVDLLFAYIKASAFAAALGLPPPAVPEEFRRRAEQLKEDLKLHGALTGLLLLNALEAGLKQAVREVLTEPPTTR